MTVEVNELRTGRRASIGANTRTRQKKYQVIGVDNPDAAMAATGIPQRGDALDGYAVVVTTIDAEEDPNSKDVWYVTVNYELPTAAETTSSTSSALSSLSFDISTQTVHRLQALTDTPQSRSFAPSGVTAPLSKGLIGWDGEKVQGVDIQYGVSTFTYNRAYTDDEFTSAFLLKLTRNACSVNDAAFWIWDAGEVLYQGISLNYSEGGVAYDENDGSSQLSGYANITGVSRDNTNNGRLYVTFEKVPGMGNYNVYLYSNSAKTVRVAYKEMAVIGANALTEDNSSGIGGTITIDQYVADTGDIQIVFPFPWQVTFKFAISENKTSIPVGDITVTAKEGWQHLDTRYTPAIQTVDSKEVKVQKAKYAYVHDVYPSMDFADLKVGDSPFT